MKGKRGLVILLIVGMILFAITFFMGGKDKDEDQRPPEEKAKSAPGWMQYLGSLASPLSPRLKLTPKEFRMDEPQVPVVVPRSDERFRLASFMIKFREGVKGPDGVVVRIEYHRGVHDDPNPQMWPRDPDPQTWPPPEDENAREGSFDIQKEGGRIQLIPINRTVTVVFE